jgi:hypothetical protein
MKLHIFHTSEDVSSHTRTQFRGPIGAGVAPIPQELKAAMILRRLK